MFSDSQPHFLLVEDDLNDAFLTQEAFEQLPQPPRFTVCSDGIEARDYLLSVLEHQEALPNLMLLDLNMPRMDGFTLLKWIKSHERLSHMPILILSTSTSPQDIHSSYASFASSYICKPRAFNEYSDLTQAVELFWMRLARLPQPI